MRLIVDPNAAISRFDRLANKTFCRGNRGRPYIKIDPAFAAANPGYSSVFSYGIDNVARAMPEPSGIVWVLADFLCISNTVRGRMRA